MMYKKLIEGIKSNPSVNNWVKEEIDILDEKDVVDVLKDLSLIEYVFKTKLNDLTQI